MYGKWWNIGHLKMNFVVVYLGSYKCEFSDFRGGVFRVGVFWVVVPCVVRGGGRRFEGPCCLHLRGGMK
jgi:hypothetical protein